MRDDFPQSVKDAVAARVGYRCSRLSCEAQTSGPSDEHPSKSVSVGVAAHITAASPGGPRFDESLTPEQRRAPENAIWLCATCAALVDRDLARFSAIALRALKAEAEEKARNLIGRTLVAEHAGGATPLSDEEVELLAATREKGEMFIFPGGQETNPCVEVGDRTFVHDADPAIAAIYVEAVESLIRRGLATKDECLVTLTGSGFKLARAIAPPPRPEPEWRLVDDDYMAASGIIEKLDAEGFDLRWVNRGQVAHYELQGWELVEQGDPEGPRFRFRKDSRSPEYEQVLVKKRRA